MDKEFLNRKEAAAYVRARGLPLAASTLAKFATVGGGPVMRKFSRNVVYEAAALDDWIAARLSPPKKSTCDPGVVETETG